MTRAKYRDADGNPLPLDQLPQCAFCGRPLRPWQARKEEWPGTMAKGGNGLCMTHYEAQRKGGLGRQRWEMDKQGWGRYGGTKKHANTPAEKAAARQIVPEDLWDMLDIREST